MDEEVQFKKCTHSAADFMNPILWKLATKSLKHGEWKQLARNWHFTDENIAAIEHQYTGNRKIP